MSKRFGRQQKRKLRAQISSLEVKVSDLKRQLDELREISKRNRQIVEETAELFGRHFITLDPAEISLYGLAELADEWRVHDLYYRPSPSAFAYSGASKFMEDLISHVQCLPVMKCKAFLDDVQGAVHFRFTFNGKQFGYAISQSAIMQRPGFREAARKNVAEAATRAFMDREVPA